MKKIFLIPFLVAGWFLLQAQTWKAELQPVSGNHQVKTLKIKPDMHINIQLQLQDNDSIRESNIYDGYFIGATKDSIHFRLKEFRSDLVRKKSGFRQQLTMKPGYLFKTPNPDSSMKAAWKDVDYFWSQNEKMTNLAEIGEPIILGSLLFVLLSPLISYDYKDGKMNTARYKNWALGSTIGLAAGILFPVTVGLIYKKHKFQFKTGWPEKNARVWEFRK